ncbi:hypothetical protein PHJA_001429200 [Phtheirospermum japonicum]|uniref:S-protein homolog n=1 Tax=Phtheirospermum japonicum TaxID=374723 RepID=A0A830C1G7_9LAMI|nr:hypothetical protein PHJA_001429200 [Phtheirospermum japonicum]
MSGSRKASIGIASIIFLFVLSPTLIVEIEAKVLGKHNIKVYSDLPEKSYSLSVHCGSKDDDFGSRVLYHGQSFDWNFRTNLIGNTLYFCTLLWGPQKISFDAFKGGWDKNDYHHDYIYVVDRTGVYLSHDPNNLLHNLQPISQWV